MVSVAELNILECGGEAEAGWGAVRSQISQVTVALWAQL